MKDSALVPNIVIESSEHLIVDGPANTLSRNSLICDLWAALVARKMTSGR